MHQFPIGILLTNLLVGRQDSLSSFMLPTDQKIIIFVLLTEMRGQISTINTLFSMLGSLCIRSFYQISHYISYLPHDKIIPKLCGVKTILHYAYGFCGSGTKKGTGA